MKRIIGASIIVLLIILALKTNKTSNYKVDPQKSTVVWIGKKVTGEHRGTIPISSGNIIVEDKKINSGIIELNVDALTVTDIADKDGNAKLVGHLKNDDFFSTAKYPTAKYVITKVESKGGDNYTVNGNLTIKGITNPVSFPAIIKTDAKSLTASGTIVVNRTKYDIKFKSASFFENLGDKAIYDDFTIEVNLVANL
jgi:polyisoprenoid-binding protein YceI